MQVRTAQIDDLERLTEIYNHYIRTDHATFDVDPYTLEQRREWFAHYDSEGPHRLLVAEQGGDVVGYASSSPFRTRPAYRRSVETSVYLDASAHGQGVGRLLYDTLFPLLDSEELHRAYAGIALPNPASVALHRRVGFTPVGVYTEVGYKFGRYIDVAWFERPLGTSTATR